MDHEAMLRRFELLKRDIAGESSLALIWKYNTLKLKWVIYVSNQNSVFTKRNSLSKKVKMLREF